MVPPARRLLGSLAAARHHQHPARPRRSRRDLRDLRNERCLCQRKWVAVIETRKLVEATRSASPEETRERILTAAREVIGRKGKRGATTREIADVAGVNEATLFRHFGTKEALLVACAQHFCGHMELAGIAASLTGALDEDLLVLARLMFDRFEENHDTIRWSLVEEEYQEDVFAETAWRPQLALLGVLIDFMRRRVATGELRGEPQK